MNKISVMQYVLEFIDSILSWGCLLIPLSCLVILLSLVGILLTPYSVVSKGIW